MSKYNKLTKKIARQYGNKNTDNSEEVKKSMKLDREISSPKRTSESRLSGHSTPIHKREYIYDAEDSPELDYNYSPISQQCTQDGGNEIAWDWQVSASKSSNDKPMSAANLMQTPKRTKQLQKKRNSNSPLLQKPLKRKQMRMQNMENIGKLTAELKALTEKMKTMQGNSEIQTEPKMIDFDDDNDIDFVIEVREDNDKPKITIQDVDKKETNYEDLFDDSIEDSMVRCSQEIEEKLRINKSKGSMELSIVAEKQELELCISEKEIQYATTSHNSNLKNSGTSKSSLPTNTSNHFKTYSNNSSKMSSNCSISSSKNSSEQKRILNNNMLDMQNGKVKDLSDFPDDSFDDCLATCIEDEKLLSKSSEYDFGVLNINRVQDHQKKTYSRQSNSNTIGNKRSPSNCAAKPSNTVTIHNKTNDHEISKLSFGNDLADDYGNDSCKETLTEKVGLENRKFFKTKSLSGQYFQRLKNSSTNNKANKVITSSEKPYQSNTDDSLVSNRSSITYDQVLYASNDFPSNSGTENVTIDGLQESQASDRTVKYMSTSNLSTQKETAKSVQPTQCTPQEIERKRLEAKMKLEAKRKLQRSSVSSSQSVVPVKRPVKR
nr:bromodomain-containing protein DDB_G0270170-like isoform X1 [Megalopta genalis]